MIKNYFSLFTFIAVFIFSNMCQAQLFHKSLQPYWVIYDDETNTQTPKAFNFNFKEMNIKTGNKISRYVYNYDEEGRLSIYWEEKSKSKKKNNGFVVRYAQSQKKLKQRIFEFKNDVAYCSDSSVFNKFDEITLYLKYDKNNKLKTKDVYVYDSTLIKEHVAYSYKKNIEKTLAKEIYEYETDFQLKKITYYNKKQKAYKKTVFDCNPIGVNRKISKDSAYKCVKYEVDSLGNKMKITIENVKKKSTKVIKYFNSQNKLIAQKNFDLKKNWPNSFVFYNAETGSIMKFIYFHKGKEEYKTETTVNDKNNIVEIITYSRGKPVSFFKNEFNKEGLITESKGYNKKHKLTRTITYFYGLKE